jgi:hypothetical protein
MSTTITTNSKVPKDLVFEKMELTSHTDKAKDVCSSIDETLKRCEAVTGPNSSMSAFEKKWEEFQNLFQEMNRRLVQNLQMVVPMWGNNSKDVPEWIKWHGRLGDQSWPPPICVSQSDALSRAHYTDVTSSEYCDHPAVLDKKIDILVKLFETSKHGVLLTGAGISTGAGANIPDYASKNNPNSTVVSEAAKKNRLTKDFILNKCEPTYAHRAFATLVNNDVLKFWLQQNHDGLAQKAGCDHSKLCPIHGEVFDPKNPVVPMSGSLRPDLVRMMRDHQFLADFVCVAGSSLSGMSCDNLVKFVAGKFIEGTRADADATQKQTRGNGACIIAIQKTQMDWMSSLRIFGKLDDVCKILMSKMKKMAAKMDMKTHPIPLNGFGFEYLGNDGKRIQDDRDMSKWNSYKNLKSAGTEIPKPDDDDENNNNNNDTVKPTTPPRPRVTTFVVEKLDVEKEKKVVVTPNTTSVKKSPPVIATIRRTSSQQARKSSIMNKNNQPVPKRSSSSQTLSTKSSKKEQTPPTQTLANNNNERICRTLLTRTPTRNESGKKSHGSTKERPLSSSGNLKRSLSGSRSSSQKAADGRRWK